MTVHPAGAGQQGGAGAAPRGFHGGFHSPMRTHREVSMATSHYFCWGFRGPICTLQGQGLAAAPHSLEERHRGSNPGLRAILQCAGHTGGLQDSGWSHGVAVGVGGDGGNMGGRGPGSCAISHDGSLVVI